MCAFFLYRMDVYPLIKDRFPGFRITEVTREIGEMWKALDQQTREKYEEKAAEEKERVMREREQYEALYGKPLSRRKRKRQLKKDMEVIKKYLNDRDKI